LLNSIMKRPLPEYEVPIDVFLKLIEWKDNSVISHFFSVNPLSSILYRTLSFFPTIV
jgi:hypothetical protein